MFYCVTLCCKAVACQTCVANCECVWSIQHTYVCTTCMCWCLIGKSYDTDGIFVVICEVAGIFCPLLSKIGFLRGNFKVSIYIFVDFFFRLCLRGQEMERTWKVFSFFFRHSHNPFTDQALQRMRHMAASSSHSALL